MCDKKLVSIIVPCYNHEKFLDDCLKGILDQSYETIELLICDDCSPDHSYEKIKGYEEALKERLCRVEIVRNEINQGVTKNINRMLSLAKGEYIKIIASDDVLLPQAVEKAVEYFETHLDKDIVICNCGKIKENQSYGQYKLDELAYIDKPDFEVDNLLEKIYALNTISAPGAFLRMAVFDKVGNYDESIAIEDWEFWLRILSQSDCKFGYLEQPLILYRINDNSMTSFCNNAGLERRRMRIYTAEVAILNKYKGCVSEELAAQCIIDKILSEKDIAVSLKLMELEKLINKDLKDFSMWKKLSIKSRIKCFLRLGKIFIKKCLK